MSKELSFIPQQEQKPIEALQQGEQVRCLSGWRKVQWIGWRNFGAAAFRTDNYRAAHCPVLIRRNAIADNVPNGDLIVSPWHHLYIDGLLVRAIDLLNGGSIFQDMEVREMSYYHLELDQFDVLLSSNVYSESWADGGNRDFFQNVDVTVLRPEDRIRHRAHRPGFTVIRPGDVRLADLRAKINSRDQAHLAIKAA